LRSGTLDFKRAFVCAEESQMPMSLCFRVPIEKGAPQTQNMKTLMDALRTRLGFDFQPVKEPGYRTDVGGKHYDQKEGALLAGPNFPAQRFSQGMYYLPWAKASAATLYRVLVIRGETQTPPYAYLEKIRAIAKECRVEMFDEADLRTNVPS
jgi:hypothetical protein